MQSSCPSKLQVHLSRTVANLDFDARVPVPFSVFPSSYKEKTHEVAEQTHEELEIRLPEKAGREGQYSSSVHTSVHLPPQPEPERFSEEEVHYTREEERYRRPGSQVGSKVSYHEDYRRPASQVGSQVGSQVSHHEDYRLEKYSRPQTYSTPHETVEVDESYRPHYSAIDNIERTYRARSQTGYEDSASAVGTTVDTTVDPSPARSSHNELVPYTGTTADLPVSRPGYTDQVQFGGSTTSGSTVSGYTVASSHSRASQYKQPTVVEETREYPQHTHSVAQKSRMGYYDEDGRYHSFRKGLHKMADKLVPHRDHHHHHTHEVETMHESAPSASPAPVVGPTGIPNTVTIPCHHIRNGDILVLQGRPCQVIRISTSAATGQHRYLGVDLFTKQLHEESSFISHPSPSVVVQTMLGPVLKQYRVLDLADGTVTCMTETGEVKVGVPVLDQSNLWERISRAFNSGRGSVRVLVLSDQGRELAVDVKVVHGASL
ncbi:hypothetical protein DL770_004360 [Monosporascus sp. CRB-9-2]|nr:hypothetical protein DL770_004360 [Monosporascus sp. CRB-9-2]